MSRDNYELKSQGGAHKMAKDYIEATMESTEKWDKEVKEQAEKWDKEAEENAKNFDKYED